MAPVLPNKRRTKPTITTKPKSSQNTATEKPSLFARSSDPFPSNKADKRRIKHSSFVSRIEKTHSKPQKPRRPSKKLVTTLESLADALPEADAAAGRDVEVGNVRIKQRSLKSRPGAMKKKAKMEAAERGRFTKNLIEMTKGGGKAGPTVNHGMGLGEGNGQGEGSGAGQGQSKGTTARWAALRNFISNTMETKETS